MPDGRTHTLINTGVTTLIAAAAWQLGVPLESPPALAALAGAFVGTVLITPDLDMAHVRVRARRAWGLLEWLWWPLLRLSKHRGVSHTWLRGPLIRLGYITGMLTLLLLAARGACQATGLPWPPLRLPPAALHSPTLLAAGLAYWAAQALHLALDGIPLTWRRL